MIKKVLIANRGEIACRIHKTVTAMGLQSVGIYSQDDLSSKHVTDLDEVYCLSGTSLQETYLNIDKILDIARRANVDAIHPGYGFLSENEKFVAACQEAGVIFIGPSAEAILAMGDKAESKKIVSSVGIPLLPGYHGADQSVERLEQEAEKIGYPVLIKATAGGGGKGMRVVSHKESFVQELEQAKREALSAFGNETVLLEKFLEHPRHVEVQIVADKQGHILHLFDRDCSLQRRHQKIIEEAPAPNIPVHVKEKMAEAACRAAEVVSYDGVGTVEFLYDGGDDFYFMEMNTRLQVEHPVTEAITSLDLVKLQIDIAEGKPLGFSQEDVIITGHAIEARLYAEAPELDFLPQTGTVEFLSWGKPLPEIRIDHGLRHGQVIGTAFDPMIAKVISHCETRQQAIDMLVKGLSQICLLGCRHNISSLSSLLQSADFRDENLSTNFIPDHPELTQQSTQEEAAAAVAVLALLNRKRKEDLWASQEGWVLNAASRSFKYVIRGRDVFSFDVLLNENGRAEVKTADKCYQIQALSNQKYLCGVTSYDVKFQETFLQITQGDNHFVFCEETRESFVDLSEETEGSLRAPMPGKVMSLKVASGDWVEEGTLLLTMEAMKMEHQVKAPYAGTVSELFYPIGAQVQDGDVLLALQPQETL